MGRRRRADEDEDEDVDEDVTTEEDEEDVSDVSDDARADEEEEDEVDEDDELEAEMAALEAIKRERGRAKSGAVGAKTFVNNAKGLDACLEGARCDAMRCDGVRARGEGARGRGGGDARDGWAERRIRFAERLTKRACVRASRGRRFPMDE